MPQRTHASFVSLERDERVTVSKLAAILRVANTLAKGQLQKTADLKLSHEGDQIVLVVENATDLTMDRVGLASRADLFAEIFGKKMVLREASRTP